MKQKLLRGGVCGDSTMNKICALNKANNVYLEKILAWKNEARKPWKEKLDFCGIKITATSVAPFDLNFSWWMSRMITEHFVSAFGDIEKAAQVYSLTSWIHDFKVLGEIGSVVNISACCQVFDGLRHSVTSITFTIAYETFQLIRDSILKFLIIQFRFCSLLCEPIDPTSHFSDIHNVRRNRLSSSNVNAFSSVTVFDSFPTKLIEHETWGFVAIIDKHITWQTVLESRGQNVQEKSIFMQGLMNKWEHTADNSPNAVST